MNRLKGMTAYLCGAMDRVADGGVEWREHITPRLQELGVGVFNPCNKPSDYAPEDEDTRELIHALKRSEKYEDIAAIMKPICAVDLRMVDIAHFIIMNIDMDNHLCGSYHEAFVAIGQKKPVVIIFAITLPPSSVPPCICFTSKTIEIKCHSQIFWDVSEPK